MGNIRVTDLDYTELKSSLKNFLRDQAEFQDYDFDGSSLQVLLSLLAANTHLQSIYVNMAGNEMFLDSAVLRHNIVSSAKKMSYTPNSVKASTATLKLSLIQNPDYAPVSPPAFIKLPQYSKFSATLDGKNYIFTNIAEGILDYEKDSNGKRVYTGQFDVKSGIYVNEQHTFNAQDPVQRFIVSNKNADTETMVIRVYPDATQFALKSNGVLYQPAGNVVTVKSDSKIYWIQESETGKREIEFGNDVLGQKLSDLNLIDVEYLVSPGSVANNIATFSWSDEVDNYALFKLTTIANSFGGADEEDTNTIQFQAPKTFETQRRAVTAPDYKTHISDLYPNIASIATWGGEDNDPKQFGVVFASIKPKTGFTLTEAAKLDIEKNIIKPYNVGSIVPKFVDPEITWLVPNLTVKYNLQEVPAGENSLKSKVSDAVTLFGTTNLDVFDAYFRHSNLLTSIDGLENAIKSSLLVLTIKKTITPVLAATSAFEIRFHNSIKTGSVTSTKFSQNGTTNCYLKDDSVGNVSVVSMINGAETTIKKNMGTVDYLTGFVNLSELTPSLITDGTTTIKLSTTPSVLDVTPVRNQILTIDKDDITITMTNISEQFLNQVNL